MQPLQCGTDPNMIRAWSAHDPTTHETVSHPSHRRGRSSTFGDALCLEKHRVSCICYLSKTHFVRDFLQNSIGNSSTSTTCNPIYSEGTILDDPTVAKHNGIPSATHPPAPLAIPFTLRERSYSCKSQWNSIGNSSTSTTRNPIYIAGTILQLQITMEFCRPQMHETQLNPHLQCGTDPNMIRAWSAHDPTTHETVSHPSHRRGRSSTFGDALCLEKDRVSCICYLSKTHFVRDFLQNSIGNSSTSTTCNPIYSEGTILDDPTVAKHNGIPSATHPPAPLAIPFTLRERSYSCKSQWNSIGNSSTSTTCNPIYIAGTILQLQITMEFCRPQMHETQLKPHLQCGTDPNMIRDRSDHTRDRLAPVAPQR